MPQTGGEEVSPGWVKWRLGIAQFAPRGEGLRQGVFRPVGLFQKAIVLPGSVSDLYVRAVEAYTEMLDWSAISSALRAENCLVSNESLVVNAHRFTSSSWTDSWTPSFPLASSMPANPTWKYFGSRWISFRCQPAAYCTSKTHRCCQIAESLGIEASSHGLQIHPSKNSASFGLQKHNEDIVARPRRLKKRIES